MKSRDRIQSLESGKECGGWERRGHSTANYKAKDVEMCRAEDWGPWTQPTSAIKNSNTIFPSYNTTSKEKTMSLTWRYQGNFCRRDDLGTRL